MTTTMISSSASNFSHMLRLSSQLTPAQCQHVLSYSYLLCSRCLLRFLGCFNWPMYYFAEEQIEAALKNCFSLEHLDLCKNNKQTCFICLNIQSDDYLNKMIAHQVLQAAETLVWHESQVIRFKMAMIMDSEFFFRDHAFKVMVLHKLKEAAKAEGRNVLLEEKYLQHLVTMKRFIKRMLFANVLPPKLLAWRSKLVVCRTEEDYDVMATLHFALSEKQELQDAKPAELQEANSKKRKRAEDADDVDDFAELNFVKLQHDINKVLAVRPQVQYHVTIEHEPLQIVGMYNKYERGVSNSAWSQVAETSVEECIGMDLMQYFKGKNYTFQTAGREDVDVRMLGNGRPFILQIDAPIISYASEEQLEALALEVNKKQDSVAFYKLKIGNKQLVKQIQEAAEEKKKSYRCIVWVSNPVKSQQELDTTINLKKEIAIQQKTPIRVIHRRAIDIRKRIIHSVYCYRVNDHYLVVEMETQAGTYVKEFISSDFGRTYPSFGTLLGNNCQADILQLDVTGIQMQL